MSKQETSKKKIQYVSESVISKITEKHDAKKLKRVYVGLNDEAEELEVIIKAPSRQVRYQWEKFNEKDPQRAEEVLFQNCVLTSKEEIEADDELFDIVMSQVYRTMSGNSRSSRTKNF